jgi:dipeptidase E
MGIGNTSIYNALVDLLGKPIAESNALFIPTAIYPFPHGASMAWQAICGKTQSPFCQLGWKSLGVLELTALPSIEKKVWIPAIQDADALLVWGEIPCICPTGCKSPDWQTYCHRFYTSWSMWE